MRLVNKKGLPEPLFLAIKKIADAYDNGGSYLSCSGVLKPAKIFHLERRHSDEIEVDAIHRIPSFLGSLQHDSCEAAAKEVDDVLVEQRHYQMVNGFKFSGQYDLYWPKDFHLQDYKQTTSFQVMKAKEDWSAQLSCLKWLMHQDGVKVRKGSIEATVRDYSPSKAQWNKSYPQQRHVHIPIKLWSLKDTEKFIKDRIDFYQSFEDVADDDIPHCSTSDRWSDGDKYAVKKKRGKKALKLHSSLEAAEKHAIEVGGDVEVRKGFDRRCIEEGYCDCREFCNYYKENHKGNEHHESKAPKKKPENIKLKF